MRQANPGALKTDASRLQRRPAGRLWLMTLPSCHHPASIFVLTRGAQRYLRPGQGDWSPGSDCRSLTQRDVTVDHLAQSVRNWLDLPLFSGEALASLISEIYEKIVRGAASRDVEKSTQQEEFRFTLRRRALGTRYRLDTDTNTRGLFSSRLTVLKPHIKVRGAQV
ncbi:hypothetical protein RRG08_002200 [Elysia crispata]|uniref:Uncharacterized protein n=1 Tax=Elysia crispata TaxID=231223 RepID=A0AAE0ZCM0_9GAST|nr:hypothetical protein RRG08_002200 [Elysia crispata]